MSVHRYIDLNKWRPTGSTVIVKMLDETVETGGITLISQKLYRRGSEHRMDHIKAVVVSVGPKNPDLVRGDIVYVNPYAGRDIRFNSILYCMLDSHFVDAKDKNNAQKSDNNPLQ